MLHALVVAACEWRSMRYGRVGGPFKLRSSAQIATAAESEAENALAALGGINREFGRGQQRQQ
jgi:hypothetical protein